MTVNNETSKPGQAISFDIADLEEFCLWLYGIYEEEIVKCKLVKTEGET